MRNLWLVGLMACGGVETPDEANEQEVITTVVLTFDGPSGSFEVTWADPENDGDPVVDAIELASGEIYDVTVRFLNELESPPEEITDEVAAEAEAHQVFFTGSALDLLDHSYADADSNGYDVGLDNTFAVTASGSGELIVTLRHLPEESGQATKTGDLAATVASDGFSAIPGDSDAQVTFDLTIP